ncbi:MAG: 3-deoxy-manno-octulosonate cytidylyltransferase [Bacteroidales bacterium]|nr:3-deoxy-manno-octulosonate cytidylyltransferase [Bacteroidales bacterium]
MKILAIIPARYSSVRFPGKPLIDIGGKPMIERVYERVFNVIDNVIIATDDYRIADTVKQFGGNYVMTSNAHKSGTDRCAEALLLFEESSGKQFDAVINIQGDEPFIEKEQLKKVIELIKKPNTQIASLVKKIDNNEDIFNSDKPKVVLDKYNFAIYFSRSPIPFIRDSKREKWHLKHNFLKHIGIYAYKSKVLQEITKLKQSKLETAESLEQNRWVENGYKIALDYTDVESISVDTKSDLDKILKKHF